VGARCGVPHGTGNGILLPHVMRYNADAAGPKLALVARALGHAEGADNGRLALVAADAVAAMLVRIEHPTRLSKVGVSAGDFEECAALALTDGATMTNPRTVSSVQEIVAVYRQAL
jgi:alcohol dehydrogenase class IV